MGSKKFAKGAKRFGKLRRIPMIPNYGVEKIRKVGKGKKKLEKLVKGWDSTADGNYERGQYFVRVIRRGHKGSLGTLYRKAGNGKLMLPPIFSGKLKECFERTAGINFVGPDMCECLSRKRAIRRDGPMIIQSCASCGRFIDSIKDERVSGSPESAKALIAEAFMALRKLQKGTFEEVRVEEKYNAVMGFIGELEEASEEAGERIAELEHQVANLEHWTENLMAGSDENDQNRAS